MHLRIETKLATPAQVEKYFIKRRSEEAYYCENQEFNGFWGGKAAKLLGLKDYMANEEFSRLCHNLHPVTGEQLTPRMAGNCERCVHFISRQSGSADTRPIKNAR